MANKKRKSAMALPAGVITIILAIIGLVTIVRATVNFVENKADNTALKQQYEEFLTPVVMFDPDPFDDLTKADNSQLLFSAIWSLLSNEDGMSKYPYYEGETIGIQVPQEDIEAAFTKLYGNEINIAELHSSIDMSGYDITYASAIKSYILPITGVDAAYTPKVLNIEKKGSSLILNVGYISSKAWADIGNGEYTSPEPDKYMKITLRERSGGMYVSSIQNADSLDIAQSLTNTQVVEENTEPATETPIETIPEETTVQTTAATEVVTDENGEPVTDENGETVTQAVTTEDNTETTVEETTAA